MIRAGDDPSAPLLLGEYKESGGVITFTPRFEPSPGVELHVSFKPMNAPEISATFGEPAKAIVATNNVAHLYPSSDTWPANTLKMYVEFSAPMSAGDAYAHIRVLDDQGHFIVDPFVTIEPELWDPSGTRLTLLFDPGRIKRGLVDNEESGPPLMPGRVATIEVDPAMRDATGAPLAEKFSREIRVVDALREVIDVKRWRVSPPSSPGADLVIDFDRPLDHALAHRAISITRGGSPVAGKISLEENETRFRFTPDTSWPPGRHTVRVDGVIEDLAGNRLGKLFDVDTSDPLQSDTAAPSAEIPFEAPAR
ncbi:MAG: Ig-like domain-containing protein [Hyphomonadaceae bacterium]|nr:Ig-like domain-containing protein [Hyphomonadaceae bacterium]